MENFIAKDFDMTQVDWLYALNQACSPEVGSLSREDFISLMRLADLVRVYSVSDSLVGAVVVLFPDRPYDSTNYQWFQSNEKDFLYVDRIMVDESARGMGLGKWIYRELSEIGKEKGFSSITCEVNEIPPNPKSMSFHKRVGFEHLLSRVDEKNDKTVGMLKLNIPD